jgi:hypothetical protein
MGADEWLQLALVTRLSRNARIDARLVAHLEPYNAADLTDLLQARWERRERGGDDD